MRMVFIQKRIDKRIVFWDPNLQPTATINRAARYNGFDTVASTNIGALTAWVRGEKDKVNFNTVIVPICIDEDGTEPNELGEQQEPTTIMKHLRMIENIRSSFARVNSGFNIADYLYLTTDTDIVRRVQVLEKKAKEEYIPW